MPILPMIVMMSFVGWSLEHVHNLWNACARSWNGM